MEKYPERQKIPMVWIWNLPPLLIYSNIYRRESNIPAVQHLTHNLQKSCIEIFWVVQNMVLSHCDKFQLTVL